MNKMFRMLAVGLITIPTLLNGNIVEANSIENVNVKLQYYLGNKSEVTVKLNGNYTVENNSFKFNVNENYQVKVENGMLVVYQGTTKIKEMGSTFRLIPTNENNLIYINNMDYLGTMQFTIEGNQYVRPVNTLNLEKYLKGVVPIEMSDSWGNNGGLEALKAQAVAARTYVSRYGSNVITDTESHQVYGGYNTYVNTSRAVDETSGKVAKNNGKLVEMYYSSTNGGKVLSNVNSWGGTLVSYLTTKNDPYDLRSGNSNVNWLFTLAKTQIDMTSKDLTNPDSWWSQSKELDTDTTEINNMKTWLKNNGYIGSKYEVKVIAIPDVWFKTTFSSTERIDGRITLEYYLKDTTNNQYVMENGEIKKHSLTIERRAYDIRAMFGTSIMKSPYIKSVVDNGNSFTANGGGWGHGIGMSQYGAYQMAKEGHNYVDILNFYYNNPVIEGEPAPVVEQPTTQPTEPETVTTTTPTQPTDTETVNNETSTTTKPTIVKSLIAYEKTYMYKNIGDTNAVAYLSPQVLEVIQKQGEYYQIHSWLGPVWVKPSNPIEADIEKVEKKISLTEKVYLHKMPLTSTKTSAYISPQQVDVIEQWGNWVKVKTWLGPMWLKIGETPIEPTPVQTVVPKLTLKTTTPIYKTASTEEKAVANLSPQTVQTINFKGDFYQINSWLGPVWIKPISASIEGIQELNTTLTLTERHALYREPFGSAISGASISPQVVKVTGKWNNYYRINSWLGPVWIKS